MRNLVASIALILVGTGAAQADGLSADVAKAPPKGAFQAVSGLVPLPDFIPGLGRLFVDPATLPAGPFLAYDRDGALASTIYMLPLTDLSDPDRRFDNLSAPGGPVDHVDVYYNAGHPGVATPHSHVVLWHVPKSDEAKVAQ